MFIFLSVFSSDKNGDDVQANWQVFCDIAILLLYCLLPLLPVACAALLLERNEYCHSISPHQSAVSHLLVLRLLYNI